MHLDSASTNRRQGTLPIHKENSRARLLGALAASLAATCFVIGLVVYFAAFASSGYPDINNAGNDQLRFMLEHTALLQTWYGIIYFLFGACLIVIVTVLQNFVLDSRDLLAAIAYVFGVIWSALMFFSGLLINVGIAQISTLYAHTQEQAITLWMVVHAILNGLGGGNELVGAAWLLLVNYSALRQERFPQMLSYTGMLVAASGFGTCLPGLDLFALLFGLGTIIWFVGLSVWLLR